MKPYSDNYNHPKDTVAAARRRLARYDAKRIFTYDGKGGTVRAGARQAERRG